MERVREDVLDLLDNEFDKNEYAKVMNRWRSRWSKLHHAWLKCSDFMATSTRNRSECSHRESLTDNLRRKRLLHRGMTCLISTLPKKKIDVALKWSNRQLLVRTFGAWVREIADREEVSQLCVRGQAHFASTALLKAFNALGGNIIVKGKIKSLDEMADVLRALICYRQGIARWNCFLRSWQAYSAMHERHRMMDRFNLQRKKNVKRKYFAIIRMKMERRLAFAHRQLHGEASGGWRGIERAMEVISVLRGGVVVRSLHSNNTSMAEGHACRVLMRRALGALAQCALDRRRQRQDISFAAAAMTLRSGAMRRSVPPVGKARVFRWWRRRVSARMGITKWEHDAVEDAYKHLSRRLAFSTLRVLWSYCSRRTEHKSWMRRMCHDTYQLRYHRRIKLTLEKWREASMRKRSWQRCSSDALHSHTDLLAFRNLTTALAIWKKLIPRNCRRAAAWRRGVLFRRRTLLQKGLMAICAREPFARVCECPRSSKAGRQSRDMAAKDGGGLIRPRVDLVQYRCRVRRWHMTLACHHEQHSILTRALHTLRIVCKNREQRADMYRGIWFWKYWRQAITLCRWRKRVRREKENRDLLLASHNMYEHALGTNSIRQWVTAALDCNELQLTKRHCQALGGADDDVWAMTEVRRREVVRKCAYKWLELTRSRRVRDKARYRSGQDRWTEASQRRSEVARASKASPHHASSGPSSAVLGPRMDEGEEKPQEPLLTTGRWINRPREHERSGSDVLNVVPLSRAPPRLPPVDLFDIRTLPRVSSTTPDQHMCLKLIRPPIEGSSSSGRYSGAVSYMAQEEGQSLSERHGSDIIGDSGDNGPSNLSSLYELEKVVAEISQAIISSVGTSSVSGDNMHPSVFRSTRPQDMGNTMPNLLMSMQEKRACAQALQDYADMLEGFARAHSEQV